MAVQKNNIIQILAIAAIILFAWWSPLDSQAKKYVDSGFQRALVSFGVARALNGVISVAQGTEISVTPFGVGTNIALGEVLDPVNDLVENFSDLMLFSTAAFGVMKVLLAISANTLFAILLTVVGVSWLIHRKTAKAPSRLLTSMLAALIFVRFSIPIAAAGSDILYTHFLESGFNEAQAELEKHKTNLSKFADGELISQNPSTPSDQMKKGIAASQLRDRVQQTETSKKSSAEKLPSSKTTAPAQKISSPQAVTGPKNSPAPLKAPPPTRPSNVAPSTASDTPVERNSFFDGVLGKINNIVGNPTEPPKTLRLATPNAAPTTATNSNVASNTPIVEQVTPKNEASESSLLPASWSGFKNGIKSTIQDLDKTLLDLKKALLGLSEKMNPGPYLEAMKNKTTGYFSNLKNEADKLVERVINLIVVFVLQTIVFPLGLIWAFYRLLKSCATGPSQHPTPTP
jgi:hypothetical protein